MNSICQKRKITLSENLFILFFVLLLKDFLLIVCLWGCVALFSYGLFVKFHDLQLDTNNANMQSKLPLVYNN